MTPDKYLLSMSQPTEKVKRRKEMEEAKIEIKIEATSMWQVSVTDPSAEKYFTTLETHDNDSSI
jgi:hypothetical protein